MSYDGQPVQGGRGLPDGLVPGRAGRGRCGHRPPWRAVVRLNRRRGCAAPCTRWECAVAAVDHPGDHRLAPRQCTCSGWTTDRRRRAPVRAAGRADRLHPGRGGVVNADTTWQAYNGWGGYSLYRGPTGGGPASAVTFDRPYDYGQGRATSSAPKFRWWPGRAARAAAGLRHRPRPAPRPRPARRRPRGDHAGPRRVLVAGDAGGQVTRARDRGTNVAFLGANAIYRKIRFARTGWARTAGDQLQGRHRPDRRADPAQVTTQWRSRRPAPGDSLTGADYECNPVRADGHRVPGTWLFAGSD